MFKAQSAGAIGAEGAEPGTVQHDEKRHADNMSLLQFFVCRSLPTLITAPIPYADTTNRAIFFPEITY